MRKALPSVHSETRTRSVLEESVEDVCVFLSVALSLLEGGLVEVGRDIVQVKQMLHLITEEKLCGMIIRRRGEVKR